mgnify:CR=1 FL=1
MITVQRFFQVFRSRIQILSHLIQTPASSFIGLYNPNQPNLKIISVKPRPVFLLAVHNIILIKNVSNSGVVVTKLFCQDAGLFCLGGK